MELTTYLRARNLVIVSNTVMCTSAATLFAEIQNSPSFSSDVHQDSIFISLPVFISSMVATALFTWTIARYDQNRVRQMQQLEERFTHFERRLEKMFPGNESKQKPE